MNDSRREDDDVLDAVHRFVVAGAHDELTDSQWSDFERLLREDGEAKRIYAKYVSMLVLLPSILPTIADDESPSEDAFVVKNPPHAIGVSSFGWFGDAVRSTTGYFSSGWPMAYLVASVILGLGLVIGAVTYVSQPVQLVRILPSPGHRPEGLVDGRGAGGEGRANPDSPLASPVGRITGMVDCKWEEGSEFRVQGSDAPRPKALVSLGDQFHLASGLMEITYNSGARVILQGPVRYEVESSDGGYLSVGRLTARVEKRGEGRRARDEGIANPQMAESPAPRPPFPAPLFTVRTPTAIVTDLGTEFGVAVSPQGLTQVHVLQGAVDACTLQTPSGQPRHEKVTAGQAVEVGRKDKLISSVAYAPQSFARQLQLFAETSAETAYVNSVLADKPLGYWPLNEPAHWKTFLDRSGRDFHGYAMNKVEAGQPGPFGKRSRAVALNGDGHIELGRHDEFAMENDFTVEAWIWTATPLAHSTIFSAIGETANRIGWGLSQYLPDGIGRSETNDQIGLRLTAYHEPVVPKDTTFAFSSATVVRNTWNHVAVAFQRDNVLRLYFNGRCVESKRRENPTATGPVWLFIGNTTGLPENVGQYYWQGRLAHVAVYPRALSAERIQNHYLQRTKIADDQK